MRFPKMEFTKSWIGFLAIWFALDGLWYTTEKFISGEYVYMVIGGGGRLIMALIMLNTLQDVEATK